MRRKISIMLIAVLCLLTCLPTAVFAKSSLSYRNVVENCMNKCGYDSLKEMVRDSYRGLLYDLNGDGQEELILQYRLNGDSVFEVWSAVSGNAVCLLENSEIVSSGGCSVILVKGPDSNKLVFNPILAGSSGGAEDWYIYSIEGTSCKHLHDLSNTWYGQMEEYFIDEREVSEAEFNEEFSTIDNGIELLNTGDKTKGMALKDLLVSLSKGSLPFHDVKESDWYYDSVAYVYQNGLFSGTSSTEFSPNRSMNRAMIATVLYRLAGKPSMNSFSLFNDVKQDAYYANAVAWTDASGIANGTSDTTFLPQKDITQEQMAVMLYRYAVLYCGMDNTNPANLNNFKGGSQVGNYAQKAVGWCVSKELIRNNTLKPKEAITRAEVADILYRFSKLPQSGGRGYEQTIENILNSSAEFSFNRSSYYDLDGDGREELLISFSAMKDDFEYQVASVYTIKNGMVSPMIEKEELFPRAGGPSGVVGVIEKDGRSYLCFGSDASEGGFSPDDPRSWYGFYKLYSITNGGLQYKETIDFDLKYIGYSDSDKERINIAASGAVKTDGVKSVNMSYAEYQTWLNSITWKTRLSVV